MVRYTGPKNRIARRFGANIFGVMRNPLLHKANPPGMHGARRKKKSDYGLQLEEQQKLKAVYGMLTSKQLIRYYKMAAGAAENTNLVFIQRLECRLDNVVYRLKLAPTIFAAQQLVSHGHVLVNGKKVDRRSFEVKPGMVISLKSKSQELALVKQAREQTNREIPEYLSFEDASSEGQLLLLPGMDQIPLPLPINIPLVCEFLAHSH
jgi:small subunit ribosomal protein S4